MLRRSVYARLGPFLSVRKGGDSEYAERIESEVGPIPTIDKPLAVYRLRSGSLSRADFTFQWTSPDRLAFVGVYRAALRSGRSAPLPAPLTFAAGPVADPRTTDRLDVAYLGDLSRDPESDPALVASMALTGEADHTSAELDHPPSPSPRRGLWHLEAPWTPSVKRRPMHPGWYDRVLANRDWQVVTRVEPVHVKRLVVLDPSVLLFCDALACMVGADHVQVASPTTGTFDRDIAAPAVDRDEVQAVVRRWFGVDPEWV